jgi:hypothetical protein
MPASPARSPLGVRIQRALMALTPGLEVTHESFARHLSSAWGRNVDRVVVSYWAAGSRAMPVDAVVELARHAAVQAEDVPEAIAERLLAPIAEALRCVVIRVPEAGADQPSALVSRLLTCGGMLGTLQQEVAADLADGHLDRRAELLAEARVLAREVHKLVSLLEQDPGAPACAAVRQVR